MITLIILLILVLYVLPAVSTTMLLYLDTKRRGTVQVSDLAVFVAAWIPVLNVVLAIGICYEVGRSIPDPVVFKFEKRK